MSTAELHRIIAVIFNSFLTSKPVPAQLTSLRMTLQFFFSWTLCLLIVVYSSNESYTSSDSCEIGKGVCSAAQRGLQVIDVSPLYKKKSTDDERQIVRDLIGTACRTWGMFYIVNHGTELASEAFEEQAKIFFDSPMSVKNTVSRQVNNSRGFADDELTKQKVDMKEIFDVGHKPVGSLPDNAPENQMLDGYNQWPVSPDLQNFRSAVETYYEKCSDMALILLHAMSIDLGIDPLIFLRPFVEHTSFLRLNYYPVPPHSEGDQESLGISRHTDAGVLTLLLQDTNSALEVYSGSKEDHGDGVWVPVDPIDGALAINVCDMLQVMSNNEYKAPEHRVRASKTNKRYSSPFFFNPAYDTVIKPIVTQQSRHAVPEYSPFLYGHFRQQRFKGDYADSGTEIQIEDFRIKSRDQEKMKDQINEAEERDVRVLQEFEQSVV